MYVYHNNTIKFRPCIQTHTHWRDNSTNSEYMRVQRSFEKTRKESFFHPGVINFTISTQLLGFNDTHVAGRILRSPISKKSRTQRTRYNNKLSAIIVSEFQMSKFDVAFYRMQCRYVCMLLYSLYKSQYSLFSYFSPNKIYFYIVNVTICAIIFVVYFLF